MGLKTSLTGSYPPLKKPGRWFQELTAEAQDEFIQNSIKRAVDDQLRLGIDILVDGQIRNDIVSLYACHLPGYEGDRLPFWAVAPIQPAEGPITVHDFTIAKNLAGERPIKAHLTGPMTMARGTWVRSGSGYRNRNDPKLLQDLTTALAQEAKYLVQAGAKIVQIDEPVLADDIDLDLAFEAMARIAQFAEVPTLAIHICGNITGILERVLMESPAQIISFEGEWLQHKALNHIDQDFLTQCSKQVALGCISVSDYSLERLIRVQDFLDQMILRLGEKNIWAVTPNCGLRLVPYQTAIDKLEIMIAAAKSL